jgi:ferredoxin--NADP+ reductase
MNKYRIAIVGAGPAGYFTAQALLNSADDSRHFEIDLIERLPIPGGLVRWGVAPDHPKIKTVGKVFEKVASDLAVKLWGNVNLGTDLTLEQLEENYDAVVLATGAPIGKKLGIPGEELKGSHSAAEFVPWYNGHPDFKDLTFDLNGEVAVVIGAGNVAMDCARILALDPHELDTTDVADHALAKFHASHIRNTYIVARRGPEHVAFTAAELRDLPKLEHTDVHVDEEAINQALARVHGEEIDKDLKNNLEALLTISQKPKVGHNRHLEIMFSLAPKEIHGDESGKVNGITFTVNRIENGQLVATDETVTIGCSLVITAIGYETQSVEGVPLVRGKFENADGRIIGSKFNNLYTVGWAKRGPSGVIGTNKSDATEVVKLIVEDLSTPRAGKSMGELLASDHVVIDQLKWEKINAVEVSAGEPLGRPRVKITSTSEAISIATA